MNKFFRLLIILFVFYSLILIQAFIISCNSHPQKNFRKLELYEAEILIYSLPVAEEIRQRLPGVDVTWVLQDSPKLNQRDFFNFWVWHTSNEGTSPTVGYYSVNKYTVDVWNLSVELEMVHSQVLDKIQKIMREAHHIDEEIIDKYRNSNPYEPKNDDSFAD